MLLEKFLNNIDEVFKRKGAGGKLLIGSTLIMAIGMAIYLYAIFEKGYQQGLEKFSIGFLVLSGFIGALVGFVLTCFGLAYEKGGKHRVVAVSVLITVPIIVLVVILANPSWFYRLTR